MNHEKSNTVKAALVCSLESLLLHDAFLLESDANERSITHRLAVYLERHFSNWHVDCEYNRLCCDAKVIELLEDEAMRYGIPPDKERRHVYPDVIIHHRNTTENLLVLEVKKSTNAEPREWDICKLEHYKRELRYSYAYEPVAWIKFRLPMWDEGPSGVVGG